MKNIEMLKNIATAQAKKNPALALWDSIKDLVFAVAVLAVAIIRLIVSVVPFIVMALTGAGKAVALIVLGLIDLVETIVLYIPDVIRKTKWAVEDAGAIARKIFRWILPRVEAVACFLLEEALDFIRKVARQICAGWNLKKELDREWHEAEGMA